MSMHTIHQQIQCEPAKGWLAMTLNHGTIEEALKERREDRGLIQPVLVRNLNARGVKASQSRVSDIERGFASFMVYWPKPQDRLAVLEEYGFTNSEIEELNRKHLLALDQLLPSGVRPVAVSSYPRVDHVGTVSAGNGGSGILVTKKTVSVPDWIAERFDLEYVFAADVEGDSMTCDDVAITIPQGATAFFHRPNPKVQPRPGDIVYAYLPRPDQSVIKVFQPGRAESLLTSYNREAMPIKVSESEPAEVQGVFLGLETRASRFR